MISKIEIYGILRDFHKITGATVTIFDIDHKTIAGYPHMPCEFCKQVHKNAVGNQCCVDSDVKAFEMVNRTGQPYTYKCHCGLYETVAPVYHYGVISGYFMMGQIIDNNEESCEKIINLSKKYFDNIQLLQECVNNIPKIDSELLSSYINVLGVIADYMTQTNRIVPKATEIPEKVREYINKNYKQRLNIDRMCTIFNCSRTTLMNTFKKKFGITVGNYITQKRIEAAIEVLTTTDIMIKSVAIECGFSDQNYFSKIFCNSTGLTPTEYRRLNFAGKVEIPDD